MQPEEQVAETADEHRERILRAAFDQRESLLVYARSLLGNYSAAEDAVQEAFLVVAKKHDQFQEGTSVLAWCRAIVRLEVLKAKERYHRERTLVERILDDAVDAAFEEFQESRTKGEIERRQEALGDCVQRLSTQGRRVLQARMADELGYADIGSQLEMSVEAVRKALFRAKKQLRSCIESKLRTSQ
ncbi:MAG: sigma-70 family RNA polymerase sigma factor [Aureliella sp.]